MTLTYGVVSVLIDSESSFYLVNRSRLARRRRLWHAWRGGNQEAVGCRRGGRCMCVRGWDAPHVLLLARLFSRGGLEDISACTSSLEITSRAADGPAYVTLAVPACQKVVN